MDKDKFIAEAKAFVKKWAPIAGCILAVIAIFVGLCMSISVKAKINAVEKANAEAMVSWREDMAKSVANLAVNCSNVEKELASVKADLDAFHEEYGSSIAGIKFMAEPYPVKYTFTERSAEEFKDFVLNTQLPITKTVFETSDDDFAQQYTYYSGLTAEQLLAEYGMDSAVLGIELVDENIARIGGMDGAYDVQEDKFYSDGYLFGTISDDVLTFSQESYGIPLVVNFYREGGEAEEIGIVEKLELMNSRIRSLASQIQSMNDEVGHIEEDLDGIYATTAGLQESVDAHEEHSASLEDRINDVSDKVYDLETYVDDTVAEGIDLIDGIKSDIEGYKEEAYVFADQTDTALFEIARYIDETVDGAETYFEQLRDATRVIKDDLYGSIDMVNSLADDYAEFQTQAYKFAQDATTVVNQIGMAFNTQQSEIEANARSIADLIDKLNEVIDTLEAADQQLDEEMASLKDYVDLKSDDVASTFDARMDDEHQVLVAQFIDRYDYLKRYLDESVASVSSILSEIKGRIGAMETHVDGIEEKAGYAHEDVLKAVSGLQEKLAEDESIVEGLYQDACGIVSNLVAIDNELSERLGNLEGFASEYGF